MKYRLMIPMVLVGAVAFSQPDSTKSKVMNLRDRFALMKSSSQTFQDYKVIKEVVLDGVWKISQDSVKNLKATLVEAKNSISQLEKSLAEERQVIANARASREQLEYDSTHISLFGISFTKTLFVTTIFFVFVALLVLISSLVGRLKFIMYQSKETKDLLSFSTQEFEDYKRKALEKQARLSRELQNERNRIAAERIQSLTGKSENTPQIVL